MATIILVLIKKYTTDFNPRIRIDIFKDKISFCTCLIITIGYKINKCVNDRDYERNELYK